MKYSILNTTTVFEALTTSSEQIFEHFDSVITALSSKSSYTTPATFADIIDAIADHLWGELRGMCAEMEWEGFDEYDIKDSLVAELLNLGYINQVPYTFRELLEAELDAMNEMCPEPNDFAFNRETESVDLGDDDNKYGVHLMEKQPDRLSDEERLALVLEDGFESLEHYDRCMAEYANLTLEQLRGEEPFEAGINFLGNCLECDAPIYAEDEMLPDYPGLYQCPKCGHPHNLSE